MPTEEAYPLNLIPHLDRVLPVLEEFKDHNPADFALNFNADDFPVSVSDIARQLDCYQRARQKLDGIHKPGMLYTKEALEQSTGSAVINYKQNLFSGDNAVDLTGGLGMDSLMLSRKFKSVIYLDKNPTLVELARHNHKILGCDNIIHVFDEAENWLKAHEGRKLDLIYLDPSRRGTTGRVFLLKDCEPDVRLIYPWLDQLTHTFAVKVSPLYDLTQLQRELPYIHNIFVFSVHGETREILVICKPGVEPGEEEGLLHVTTLDKHGNLKSELARGFEDQQKSDVADQPGLFIYEPDAGIIKSGFTHQLGNALGLKRLNHTTDYLTSNDEVPGFAGTVYAVQHIVPYKPRHIQKFLTEEKIKRVHIHKRDFPHSAHNLYSKFGLEMGEQAHLIFTRNAEGDLIMLICNQER